MDDTTPAPSSVGAMFRLDGKVALLNGAGRGIGAASALALAEAGAHIAIRARTVTELERTAEAAEAFGVQTLVLPASDDVDDDLTAIQHTVDHFGRLDVLVNVVGGSMPGPFLQTRDKDWMAGFQHNVVSAIRLVRAAAPHLLETNGNVVNVSSAIGHLVGRGYSLYGTMKAALDHATELLAADLAPRIRVNAVAPGAINTDALAVVMRNDEMRSMIERLTPMRRLGEPADIAAAVLYLASPAAGYVTGTVLRVDGGTVVPNFDLGLADL